MGKEVRRIREKKNLKCQKNHLRKEQRFVDQVFCAFDSNDVKALIILEKRERQMSVMSNGISGEALLTFVVDLFMQEPEIHKATTNILNDMKADMEVTGSSTTIH